MTLKSSNKVETNRYELVIEIDGETFMKAVEAVYKRQSKNITLPGFRKGKAPRRLIEKEYGEGVFYEDAIKDLYPAAIVEASEEANLAIVRDQIDLDVEKADKEGLVIKAVITVEPEVEIKDYKGIAYKPVSLEVTDEDVEEEIKKVQKRNGRLVTVEDRAAQNDDVTVIDFKGLLDGVAFEGGTAENYSLTLGSGAFIPGFEEQVVGHKAGEEFTIDVTFPEDYQAEELAGKPVQFEIKLHEIKTHELPEVDDEFVKDVSEFDTVDEYKADLKTKLEESRKTEAENSKESQIAEKLTELLEAEIPEAMYENQIDSIIDEFSMNLRSQGIDLNTYIQYTGLSEERLRDTYRDRAEGQVKLRLALRKIAELEGLKASDEDVESKYNELAETYKVDVKRVKAAFGKRDIAGDIEAQRAMDFVKENAVEKADEE
ncbi:MAG: trigger factor [Clostridia bacterium]|nr:trigger factor [Clostridia bacterium]